jgi:hypothetical protein
MRDLFTAILLVIPPFVLGAITGLILSAYVLGYETVVRRVLG